MSHAKIYQIGLKPIAEEDYASPDTYIGNSSDFADYIGDAETGDRRLELIKDFADTIKDVFAYVGDGVFIYKGGAALADFKQQWLEAIRKATAEMDTKNMTHEMRLYRLRCLTEETHLKSDCRVDIDDNGCASPIGDLFEWAEDLLIGDKIYVGAVIDYHF